jgi:Domain of unknown function (DUF4411)
MPYLLDSSTLITANNKYHALDTVPEFWDWLAHKATSGQVKMPIEMLEEIKDGPKDGERDLLFAWIQVEANRKALLLDEDVDMVLVQQVVEKGYAPDLTDDEIDVIGRDPFLVAYAVKARRQVHRHGRGFEAQDGQAEPETAGCMRHVKSGVV